LNETLPGLVIDTWWGLVAPASTPQDVVQKLHQAFAAALNDPDTKTRFALWMAEPTPSSPAQFGQFMAAERQRYEAVVKQSGAKVD
jgi:tripartite-type tricarboxylate transporter receptor subunit TctC